MPAPQIIGVEEKILETIDAMRAKYRACTARQVAAALKLDHSYVSRKIQLLGAQGVVGFDPKVPGSIHRAGTAECVEVDGVWTPVGAAEQLPSAPPPPPIKLGIDPERAAAAAARRAAKAQPVKKQATKKAPAKKAAAPTRVE